MFFVDVRDDGREVLSVEGDARCASVDEVLRGGHEAVGGLDDVLGRDPRHCNGDVTSLDEGFARESQGDFALDDVDDVNLGFRDVEVVLQDVVGKFEEKNRSIEAFLDEGS